MTYRVLSPDGFAITHTPSTYRSLAAARRALTQWVQNYRAQGYYSQTCWNGYVRHIPLNELPDYCTIQPV